MSELHEISASDVAGSLQRKSKVLVFAASWIPYSAWHQFNQKFAEFRFRNRCWGEIKFNKCTAQYLDHYKQVIELFFDTDGLNFSSLIVEKEKLKKRVVINGKPSWQSLKNADDIHSFHIYMHLSHSAFDYCQNQSHLTLLYDTGELKNLTQTTARKIENYFKRQQNRPYPTKELTVHCSSQITSHSLYLMQICDLLAGAIHRKWCSVNDKQANDYNAAKDELVHFIEEKLKYDYPKANHNLHESPYQKAHIKLNRWPFKPNHNRTYQHLS